MDGVMTKYRHSSLRHESWYNRRENELNGMKAALVRIKNNCPDHLRSTASNLLERILRVDTTYHEFVGQAHFHPKEVDKRWKDSENIDAFLRVLRLFACDAKRTLPANLAWPVETMCTFEREVRRATLEFYNRIANLNG